MPRIVADIQDPQLYVYLKCSGNPLFFMFLKSRTWAEVQALICTLINLCLYLINVQTSNVLKEHPVSYHEANSKHALWENEHVILFQIQTFTELHVLSACYILVNLKPTTVYN
jgi:hypothetical protein